MSDAARSESFRLDAAPELSPPHTRSGRVYGAAAQPVVPSEATPFISGINGAVFLASTAIGSAINYGLVQWAKWVAPPMANPKANGLAGDVYHDSYLSFKYRFSPPKTRFEVFASHPPSG